VLDEQGVDGDPVLRVDLRREVPLGLLGRPGPNDPEPVRDPVDVGVDRDRRYPVPEDEDAVRGLRADAGHRRELVERPRDRPLESVPDLDRDPTQHPGLRVVEPGAADQPLDLPHGSVGERIRVRIPGEEPFAGHVGRLVPRALREDRSDEDLEGILRVVA